MKATLEAKCQRRMEDAGGKTNRRQVSTLIHSFHAASSSAPASPGCGVTSRVPRILAGRATLRSIMTSAPWNVCERWRSVIKSE